MEPVESFESDLLSAMSVLSARSPYVDVVAEVRSGVRVRHDPEATSLEYRPRIQGVAFRAWDGSGWIDGATSRLGAQGLRPVIDGLRKRLERSTAHAPPPGDAATGRFERTTTNVRPTNDWSLERWKELAQTYCGWAMAVPGIATTSVRVEDVREERLFLSSVGARRLQRTNRLVAYVVPVAIEAGKVEFDYLGVGGTGGAELLDALTEEKVRTTAREAVALLQAKAGPVGRMNVLMDPGTAGTFAHESFGHGTEADQLLRDRSYLKPLLGQQVGPECLTLVDDGSYPSGWGSIFYDDEGFASQRTVLVDRGRFVEVLHDRDSAAAMGRRPTGNCRRAEFYGRPFVRMTNTFVEPQNWSLEELVKEAKDGVLLESCTSGIEDPLGGQMQIKVKKGHRIEHGELTSVVPSMALSGRVLDVLRTIRGVGRPDVFTIQPGTCGKGHSDMLPAGTGGTYLLAEAIVGPA
jgi:TldD protein